MKCTNCQAETNHMEDIHCRKIFKDRLDDLILKKEFNNASKLFRTIQFLDSKTKLWKDGLETFFSELVKDKQKQKIYYILNKVRGKELLNDEEIVLLKESKNYKGLGYNYFRHYQLAGDLWDQIKASSLFRDAGHPEISIQITRNIDILNPNKKAVGALLTSRGAAFKDLGYLGKAKICAQKAISTNRSFYPYTLLGAINILEENFEEANQLFEEAVNLGASRRSVDIEIQKAAVNLSDEAKNNMRKTFTK